MEESKDPLDEGKEENEKAGLKFNIQNRGNQNCKRHMYPNVHCSTVYNSQDMEATYISIARRMHKKAVVYIHNGVLLLLLLSHFSRVRLCATP